MEQKNKKKRNGIIALVVVLAAALVVAALWGFGALEERAVKQPEEGEFIGLGEGVWVGGDDVGRTTILSFFEGKLYVCHVSALVTPENLGEIMSGAFYYSYDYEINGENLELTWPDNQASYAIEAFGAESAKLKTKNDAALMAGLYKRLGDSMAEPPKNLADSLLTRAFLEGAWAQQVSDVDGYCKYKSFYISPNEFYILPFETTVAFETSYNKELGFVGAVGNSGAAKSANFEFEVLGRECIRISYAGAPGETLAESAEYGVLILGEYELYLVAAGADEYQLGGVYNKSAPQRALSGVWMLPYSEEMGEDGYYHLWFVEITDTEVFIRDYRADYPEFDFSSLGQYYSNPADIAAKSYRQAGGGYWFVEEGAKYYKAVILSDNLVLVGAADGEAERPVSWTMLYRFPE